MIRQAQYVTSVAGTIQSISPDARLMVIADGEHLGLQPLDGSDPVDVPVSPEFRLRSLVGGWSSDGFMVAFLDRRSTATTFDSTLWLLDTREPAIRLLVSEQDIVVFDVAVAPDGTVTLSGDQRDRGSGLFTVSESGEPQPLAPTLGLVFEWLPDGSALLMTQTTDQEGLWTVDPGDGSSELVIPADAVLGTPYLIAVSADSAWALVYYRTYVGNEFFPANVSHYGLVSLDTGLVTPLKVGTDSDFTGPGLAAFSPDGTWVAYTYYDGNGRDAPLVLAVRPTAGGDEQIISNDLINTVGSPPTPAPLIPAFLGGLEPVWGANDRLVLPTETWALVIDLD